MIALALGQHQPAGLLRSDTGDFEICGRQPIYGSEQGPKMLPVKPVTTVEARMDFCTVMTNHDSFGNHFILEK